MPKNILLPLCIFSFSSSYALGLCSSLEDIEHYRPTLELENCGTLPTAKNFKAEQDRTAAGVLLYARVPKTKKTGEKILILLGKRKRDGKVSYLGGESKSHHTTLAETAAAELGEESLGAYATHPDLLAKAPYVDSLQDNLLYRIYFQEAPYIPNDYMQRRVFLSKNPKSAECPRYIWVSAKKLADAVKLGNTTFNVKYENPLTFYAPFWTSLNTPTSRAFLNILTSGKSLGINPPLRNRLYIEGEQGIALIQTRWAMPELPSNCPQDLKNCTSHKQIPLGTDAFSKRERVRVTLIQSGNTIKPIDQTVFYRAQAEKKILCQAIAAHQASVLKLKERFQPPLEKPADHPDNWTNEQTPTDIHLNTLEYYRKLPDSMNEEEIPKILQYIRENKEWPAFVHGASADVHQLVLSFTCLHRFMRMDTLQGILIMRGTDIQPTSNNLLCMNSSLFGGEGESCSLTSSLEIWCQDKNVTTPNFNDIFKESALLLGITDDYAPLWALCHQYSRQATSDEKGKNGVLYVLTINPQLFGTHLFPHGKNHQHSVNNTATYEETYKKLKKLNGDGPLSVSFDFPEVRLSPVPSIMIRENLRVRAFLHHPLSDGQNKKMEDQLMAIMTCVIGRWIEEQRNILPGTLFGKIPLREMVKLIFESETGQVLSSELNLPQ